MSKSEKNTSGSGEEKKTVEKIPQKSRSTGKTPKQIMSRHIKDKNDVITEEEFTNMDLDTSVSNDTSHEQLEIRDNHNRPKDEDKDPKIITPWDVINE